MYSKSENMSLANNAMCCLWQKCHINVKVTEASLLLVNFLWHPHIFIPSKPTL